jgi:hypothetical protein
MEADDDGIVYESDAESSDEEPASGTPFGHQQQPGASPPWAQATQLPPRAWDFGQLREMPSPWGYENVHDAPDESMDVDVPPTPGFPAWRDLPQEDPLVFVPQLGQLVPLSVLMRLHMQHAQEPGRTLFTKRRLARAKFTANEPQTKTSARNKAFAFPGFKHGDNPDAMKAIGVGARTKVKRRGLQKGTATNSNTRPPGWWDFITLIGFRSVAHCSYVMGHLLNKDFGGLGTRMYNLSPFTSRLNALHKTQVESPLRKFLQNAPKGYKRKIDYKVVARYGSPSNVVADAKSRYDDFLVNHRREALDAWVSLGLLKSKEVKDQKVKVKSNTKGKKSKTKKVKSKLRTATLTDKIPLAKGGTWDKLVTQKRNEVAAYVKAHFPASIWCTARQYERDKQAKTPHWDKTDRMEHEIAHSA